MITAQLIAGDFNFDHVVKVMVASKVTVFSFPCSMPQKQVSKFSHTQGEGA